MALLASHACAWLVVLACGTTQLVRAQGIPPASDGAAARAEVAAADGASAFAAGDYEGALDAYQRAYMENIDEARYLANIADCYRALGRAAEAVRFYRLFLHERPHTPQRAALEENIRTLAKPEPRSTPLPVVAPPSLPAVAAQAESAPPVTAKRAIWRRWWLWTAIGGAVVVGIGVGVGVGVSARNSGNGSFMPTLPGFGPASQSALVTH